MGDKPEKKKKTGTHSFMVNNCKFVIDNYYQPVKPLGRGAYGVVCSAINKSNKDKKVAIKKIEGFCEDLVDGKRILREVKLLRHFQHPNICGLVDLIPSPVGTPFNDMYIVLDFMETDLHKIIYSKNPLTDDHIKYFTWQILKGLKFIHTAHVLHRDLKPSNLLLNGNCDLKICDFGLARGVNGGEAEELTEYVVTRWYRAPEVMCSCQDYDTQIDVWSVGCIMAELHGRRPLFPGDDYIKQMGLIFDVLGTPIGDDYDFISNDNALDYIKSLPPRPRKPFIKLYPKANAQGLDLLAKMLEFNPKKRITVDEALKHPYLASLHKDSLEPSCLEPFDFSFEQAPMTRKSLQIMMMDEVYKSRPGEKAKREEAEAALEKAKA